jgi:hypothetical protein
MAAVLQMLASVALRTSSGSRRRSVPSSSNSQRRRERVLIAADDLTVDQARADFEVVPGLDHERKAVRPVIAAPGDEPDADGISGRLKAITVVLDFMNPLVPDGGRSAGGGRQAR